MGLCVKQLLFLNRASEIGHGVVGGLNWPQVIVWKWLRHFLEGTKTDTHSSRCDAEDSAHSANRAHGAEQQIAPQSHHELEGLRQLSIPPGSHGRAGTSSSAKIWAVEWYPSDRSRGSKEHTERYHSSSFDDKPLLL